MARLSRTPILFAFQESEQTSGEIPQVDAAFEAFLSGDLWTARDIATEVIRTSPSLGECFADALRLAVVLEVAELPLFARAVYEKMAPRQDEERAILLSNRLSLELRAMPPAFTHPPLCEALAFELDHLVETRWAAFTPKTYVSAVGAVALKNFRADLPHLVITSYELLLRRVNEQLDDHLLAVVLSNLGRARLDVGTPAETERGLQELALACRHEPDFADHFVLRANALVEAGRAEEAVACATDAIALHPFEPSLHAALAYALASSGDPASAVSLYIASWKAEPFRPERLANAAECALVAGDYAAARDLTTDLLNEVADDDLRATAELIRLEARSRLEFAREDPAARDWVLAQLRNLSTRYPESEDIRANMTSIEAGSVE